MISVLYSSSSPKVLSGLQERPASTTIAIHNLPLGAILLKAGSGWAAGFDGHAGEVHIQTAGFNVIYDFETIVPVELQSFAID